MQEIDRSTEKDPCPLYLPCHLGKLFLHAYVDAGNTFACVISERLMKQLQLKEEDLEPLNHVAVGTADENTKLKLKGQLKTSLTLRPSGTNLKFKIRPVVVQDLAMDLNLSGPFLTKNRIVQDHGIGVLDYKGILMSLRTFQDKEEDQKKRLITVLEEDREGESLPTSSGCDQEEWTRESLPRQPFDVDDSQHHEFRVYLDEDVKLPPFSQQVASIRVPQMEQHPNDCYDPVEAILTGDSSHQPEGLLFATNAVIKLDSNSQGRTTIMNLSPKPLFIPEGTRYGTLSLKPLPSANSTTQAEGDLQSGTSLNQAEKIQYMIKQLSLEDSPYLDTPPKVYQAAKFLTSYWDIFSHDGTFGKTNLVKHQILTPDTLPIKCRYRPINPSMENTLKEQLEEWTRHSVIEPSVSPWNFALVPVPKKNGKIRWCVDYRRLNDVTVKDAYPLPHIEDNLARLSKSTIFSALDGSGAFHVVELEEDAKPKTAFATPWGSFQFRRMPFGLCNGPATYSRLIAMALAQVPTEVALPYLDDIIVHSSDLASHYKALTQVFEAHRTHGLRLQLSKCHVFQDTINYLGHTISSLGIQPMKEYTAAVSDWPPPTNIKELRVFLGKTNYYRRFIPNYSAEALPLTQALKGSPDGPLTMTPEMTSAFEKLKSALVSSPILAYPRFDSPEPFILDTDWSLENRAIGATLSQVQDGEERVICFGAKKLSPSQQNYPPLKGELMAVIHFIRYFRYYLQYRPFVLRTDHQALKWINTLEAPTGMISRWLQTLCNYQFTVQHRSGKKHANADALSRAPHLLEIEDSEEDDESVHFIAPTVASTTLPNYTWEEEENAEDSQETNLTDLVGDSLPRITNPTLASSPTEAKKRLLQWSADTQQDPLLSEVRMWIREGRNPTEQELRTLPVTAQFYLDLLPHLRLNRQQQLVYHDHSGPISRARICVPEQRQEAFTRSWHEGLGHRGRDITLHALTRISVFPHMRKLVDYVIQTCPTCQKKKNRQPDQRHTLHNISSGYPFQKICIDFVGKLTPSKKGNCYILTVEDTFTRWIEAFPLAAATAENAMNLLRTEIFPRYGIPEIIHSDRGAQFTGSHFKEVAEDIGFLLTTTPAYNPKSNMVERVHKDLKMVLRAMMIETDKDWEELLPDALFALRTVRNGTTQLSPFEALFGHCPSIPIECLCPPPQTSVQARRYIIAQCHQYARRNMKEAIQRQRRRYMAKKLSYKPGDLVWLYSPVVNSSKGKKFSLFWTGPWKVEQRINPVLYEISFTAENPNETKVLQVSIDRIKPYVQTHEGRVHNPTESHQLTMSQDPAAEEIPLVERQEDQPHHLLDDWDQDDWNDIVITEPPSSPAPGSRPPPSPKTPPTGPMILPPSPLATSTPRYQQPLNLPSGAGALRRSARLAAKPRVYYSPTKYGYAPDTSDQADYPHGPMGRRFVSTEETRHHPYNTIQVQVPEEREEIQDFIVVSEDTKPTEPDYHPISDESAPPLVDSTDPSSINLTNQDTLAWDHFDLRDDPNFGELFSPEDDPR